MSPVCPAHHPIEQQTGREPIMARVSLTPTPMSTPFPGVPVELEDDVGIPVG